MSWHYAVRKEDDFYGVHEEYDSDGESFWTERPVAAEGETIDELIVTLERMLQAAKDYRDDMREERE
jgi:hypothetical protein